MGGVYGEREWGREWSTFVKISIVQLEEGKCRKWRRSFNRLASDTITFLAVQRRAHSHMHTQTGTHPHARTHMHRHPHACLYLQLQSCFVILVPLFLKCTLAVEKPDWAWP